MKPGATPHPFLDVAALEPARELVAAAPEALLRRKRLLPVRLEGDRVLVATAQPDDLQALDALERALGRRVQVALAEPRALDAAIERALLGLERGSRAAPAEREAAGGDAVALLDELLREAVNRRASDVHLEPQATELRVRFRVDGSLQVRRPALRLDAASPLLSRLKVLAGLDIAERREPQDGALAWRSSPEARPIDLRVATAPCRHGERATIRLLGLETDALGLASLGLDPETLASIRAIVRRPHGLVLLSGPTGSGKTTTLYAALREINEPDVNILTVEDPVEYTIAGVSQVQVDQVGKVAFANVLRSLLRHDPDVLMVGEIRDGETADLAVQAATTGHLVLSTVHTSTALGSAARLVDLGVEPFLVAATLSAALAQRLVRRLCPSCKKARPATPAELALLPGATTVHEPTGCAQCWGTGYRGRLALFELVTVGRELRERIARGVPESDLEPVAVRAGGRSLREDGLRRVREGATTLDEVLAATVEA